MTEYKQYEWIRPFVIGFLFTYAGWSIFRMLLNCREIKHIISFIKYCNSEIDSQSKDTEKQLFQGVEYKYSEHKPEGFLIFKYDSLKFAPEFDEFIGNNLQSYFSE